MTAGHGAPARNGASNVFLGDIIAQPAALRTVLAEVLDEDATPLRTGAALLSSARRLILTSMGSAYYSLQPVAEALDALHDNVRLIETSEILRRPVRPGDAYLVMSRSGESREGQGTGSAPG